MNILTILVKELCQGVINQFLNQDNEVLLLENKNKDGSYSRVEIRRDGDKFLIINRVGSEVIPYVVEVENNIVTKVYVEEGSYE